MTPARFYRAKEILKALAKYGPPHKAKSSKACWFCDMGEAGYSKHGSGFHDDSCIVLSAQIFLDQEGTSDGK